MVLPAPNPFGKKIVFSGVRPTGSLHIGNYTGALSVWVENQETYFNIFCVVDLHGIVVPEEVEPASLRKKSREVAALYMACGIDPERSVIFIQSHIHEHAELAWILNCVMPVGWLERMTQYKSKSGRAGSVSAGLLDYPVLQAADILLHRTDYVPVGEDQRQHVELTRDIAQRFNNLFGDVLSVPEVMVRERGSRIMALDDPESKMSKSVAQKKSGHAIGLLDPPEAIRKAIASAVTDPGRETRFGHASGGVLNLLNLYGALTGEGREEIEEKFEGKGYSFLKSAVTDVVLSAVRPIQDNFNRIMEDPAYVDSVLEAGADKVRPVAREVLREVKEAIGLG